MMLVVFEVSTIYPAQCKIICVLHIAYHNTAPSPLHAHGTMSRPVQPPPGRLECAHPSMCATCLWAYPPGCLHILQECERNSPQMNGIMDVFERCSATNQGAATIHFVWDLPENACWVDKNMVRFIYFMAMKFLVQKDQISSRWETMAERYILTGALTLSGMIMCGSYETAINALLATFDPTGGIDELEDETHKLFGVAYHEIMKLTRNSSYGNKGLFLVMSLVSPCACLGEDARQSLRDIRFRCVVCGKQEEGNIKMKACSGCQIVRYCSRSCQKVHWNSSLEVGGHKKVCPVIRKLLKLDFD
jgi:hypothetical protein